MSLSQTPTQDLPRRRRSPTNDEWKNFLAMEDIFFDDPMEAAQALKAVVRAIEKSPFLIHTDIDIELEAVSDVAQSLFALALALREEEAADRADAARSESRHE